MTEPLDPPNLELPVDELVDWLELTALFSEFRVARLDALTSSLTQLENEAEDNIAERDRALEELVEKIENEIDERRENLQDTYPFSLSAGADELSLVEDWSNPQYAFYLVCLITSHVTQSSILRKPPADNLLTRLRNRVFQVLATLAMAGLAGGPALSVGWPRLSGEAITELIQRAALLGAGMTARIPPAEHVSPAEKDGGIDVIAWSHELTPPPTHVFFAQAASGRNWRDKPVSEHARVFISAYVLDIFTGNVDHVTLIPHRVADPREWKQQNQFHRALLDRLRLPRRAFLGLEGAPQWPAVDEIDQVVEVQNWLVDYRNAALA